MKGKHGVLAAVLFRTDPDRKVIADIVLLTTATSELMGFPKRSSRIYGLELFAAISAAFELADTLADKAVAI